MGAYEITGTANFSNILSAIQNLQSSLNGIKAPKITPEIAMPTGGSASQMMSGLKESLLSGAGDFRGVGASIGQNLTMGMTSQFGMIGSTLSAVGPAGIAAGAAIAGVGMALSSSVNVAAQFQQTMSGVAAVAGATAPELEAMSTAARDAGASSVFSASQAAEAMGFLASSGMSVTDTIATLEPTLMMAAAGGLELASAGDLMAGSLAQFGLAATDATSVADTLAAGAAASNASITQMGQGLQNVGPMAASVGMSLQETTAALGVFANSNIKGAEAGTALKSMIASLLEPTKGAAAALSEMGLSADQVNPSLHSYDEIMSTLKDSHMTAQQSVAIFGKEMAANALVAVNGADSYDKLLEKVKETGKASEMAKTQTDNYKGAMDEFNGAIEEAQIALGTVLLPVLTEVTQAFTGGVRFATDYGKTIGNLAQGFGAMGGAILDGLSLEEIDQAFLSAMGIKIGEEVSDSVTDGTEDGMVEGTDAAQDDIQGAVDEAVGEGAEKGITRAAKSQAAIDAWKENFVGEIFGEAGNLEDKIKGQVEIGGAIFTALDYDVNNDFGNYRIRTPTGTIEYDSLADMRANAPEDIAEYVGRELTDLEIANISGDTQAAVRLQATTGIVLDSFLDVASSTKNEVEAAGQEIADAFTAGVVPDKATIDAHLADLRNLQLYDPEEAKRQGSENAIAYMDALSDAITSYDEAKAKYLVEPDNERAKADLDRTRANLQAQLNANPLKATIEVKSWGQFDTKSLSDIIFDPAAMKEAAAVPEKFFTGTIVPGIQSGMSAAKAAIATGQITEDDVYDAFIKPLESVTEYLPGWLDNLNTLFRNGFIDFEQYSKDFDKFLGIKTVLNDTAQATTVASVGYNQLQKAIEDCEACVMSDFGAWQEAQENLFNPSYIGAGGQAYLDWKNTVTSAASEAAMAVRSVGGAALGSAATPQSIPVSLKLDTSAATTALSGFESTAKKDVQKPLTIDSSGATASITEIDTAAKQSASKPIIIDSSQAMSAISAINSAASAPVFKTIYVNEVYTGSSGGSSGGTGGSSGGGFGYSLPPIFMARGGYVDRPTLAVVGEAGPELVVPVEKLQKLSSGGDGGINITINSPITGSGSDIEALLEQRNRELVAEITQQIAAARRGP